jgi:hypothetical protein
MAEAAGISVSLVQHICKAHGLAPHHVRRFKLSRFSEPNQRTAAGEVRFQTMDRGGGDAIADRRDTLLMEKFGLRRQKRRSIRLRRR